MMHRDYQGEAMESFKAYMDRILPQEMRIRVLQALQNTRHKFTDHPEETGETYAEHLVFTVQMGARIITCGTLLLIHGLLPFSFRHTVSKQIEKIYAILKARVPKHRMNDIDANWQI